MKKIWIYILITFSITWVIDGIISLNTANINFTPFAQLAVAGTMLIPLLGALLTKKIMKKEEKIDLKLAPKFKGNIKYYLLAWFGPAILTFIGIAVFFAIFPNLFDKNFGFFVSLMKAQMPNENITADMAKMVLLSQIISAITIAPLINVFLGFGEETGWRGFLFPALCEKFSERTSVIISGIIWGLWHAPITALGHNYGFGYFGYPWTGILAMCMFCIAIGCILSFLTKKTNSVWPAALAHGSLNAISAVGIYFVASSDKANPFVGPSATGIIGGTGFLIVAIICFIFFFGRKKKEVEYGD